PYRGDPGPIDWGVLFRKIAVQEVERHRPYQARPSEQVENPTPAQSDHNAYRNEGHNCDGKSAEAVRDPMYDAALRFGKPELHRSGGGGKGYRFRQSEDKTYSDEGGHTRSHGGHRCHERPQGDDHQKHETGAQAVCKPP